MNKNNCQLLNMIQSEVDKLIATSENRIIVAIDGPCGSGKTSLANSLKEVYDCNVFSMDDFFLPQEMRHAERYKEPGGNVHYERFFQEVITNIKANIPFQYQVFNCKMMDFSHKIHVNPKGINIVEGVYSLHPALEHAYNYKVFLDIDEKEQRERILARNGGEMLKRFETMWIPLEKEYFESFSIKDRCDLILTSSSSFDFL